MRKKVRLPFTGTYNTRPGPTFSGAGFDHRLLNCFQVTQSDRLSGTKRLQVIKRAGFVDAATPAAGNMGSAVYVWAGQGSGNKLMSCFGATNSTLYDSTTSKGALTGKARGITETSISGTKTVTMATSDSTGWYYQDGGSATKITDADYPGNASRTTVGDHAHLRGFAFIMDTEGRIYNSDINSITAWTAASYLTANAIPDIGIGVLQHRDVIVGFCRSHIEVFRVSDNPTGSPLARVDHLTQLIGALSADSITTCLDKIYFAGGRGTNISIYEYDGGTLKKISTPEVELSMTLSSATMSLTSVGMHGRHFIVVSGSFTSPVYCVEEGTWHEWTNATAHLWYKASGAGVASSVISYAVSQSTTSGKIYAINPATIVYADSGTAVTATIQTANWDGGTDKRKFLHKLAVIGDRTTGAENISIQWTKDDFVTLSTARTVDRSLTNPALYRCGSFYRTAFVLTHSAATALRLEALELEYEEAD